MPILAPSSLIETPTRLDAIAARYSLTLAGPDREIRAFGGITSRLKQRSQLLTWAASDGYLDDFLASDVAACVIAESQRDRVSSDRSVLLSPSDPTDAFYTIFSDMVLSGAWPSIPSHSGARCSVAASAVIHDSVVIGDDCVIMDNVVILPQSRLGDRVTVKPGTVIGGQGFQLGPIRGKRRLIPHAGGVVVGDDVTIGSNCCVDRGLFGESTEIHSDAHLDNFVHVAHSTVVGERASLTACVELSGSAIVGKNVWIGPNSSVSHGITIGNHAFIGIGSTVVRDIPPHAVAYGVPARVKDWQCACGTRLTVAETKTRCAICGREYRLESEMPVEI